MRRTHTPLLLFAFAFALFSSVTCAAQGQPAPAPTPESAERQLVRGLLELKTEGERRELLARRKDAATKELARLLNVEAMALADLSDYDGALSLYRLALSVTEGLDFKMGTSFILNNVGDALRQKGDYDAAAAALSRSRALAEEIDNKEAAARATSNLALVQMLRGDNAAALDSCERSIAVFESLGNKRQVAVILHNMGSLYADQGDLDQALDFFRRALPLREAAGDRLGLAKTLNNFGEVNARKGRYAEALDYFNRSLAIKREMGDRSSISSTLNSLANVARDRGDRAAALKGYEEALEIRQSLGLKGMLAETLDDLAEALLRWGENARALETSERAAALSREIGSPNTLWVARSHAGLALRALGRKREARAAFEEAVSVVERLRSQVAGAEAQRQRFFEDKVAPYQALVELSLEEGRAAEALAYAERAKARALLDVLRDGRGGRAGVTKAMTAAELARERELSGALSSLNSQLMTAGAAANPSAERIRELSARLEGARFEYESFEASLYAAHPELRVRRGEASPFEPAQARALLTGARGALLEYVSTGPNAYLFVLTGARGASVQPTLKAYKLGVGGAELSARAEEFRRALAARDMDFRGRARELYDLLLAPAAEQLRGAGALVIVPDGGLWNLPFQALVDAEGHYLIESHAVSYAPSLTVLREMAAEARRRSEGTAATLLAFGDPSGGVGSPGGAATLGTPYAPLPDAVRQVKTLAQLYGPARSRVYVGTEASEARVREEAGRFRVLQFATHAELNDERPLYSHVVLSRGTAAGGDDGLLEAWEMMNLDLHADMVVLSACDTARGHVGAGEGVIGMSWALFIAGSPTSVVSQWKVDSASTTDLMLDFHRNLLSARTSKAEALRSTALRLLRSPRPQDREYRHPFYWAGFVIVGDAR